MKKKKRKNNKKLLSVHYNKKNKGHSNLTGNKRFKKSKLKTLRSLKVSKRFTSISRLDVGKDFKKSFKGYKVRKIKSNRFNDVLEYKSPSGDTYKSVDKKERIVMRKGGTTRKNLSEFFHKL